MEGPVPTRTCILSVRWRRPFGYLPPRIALILSLSLLSFWRFLRFTRKLGCETERVHLCTWVGLDHPRFRSVSE
jgi:hypothetical protein